MKMLDEDKNALWSPTEGDIKPETLSVSPPPPMEAGDNVANEMPDVTKLTQMPNTVAEEPPVTPPDAEERVEVELSPAESVPATTTPKVEQKAAVPPTLNSPTADSTAPAADEPPAESPADVESEQEKYWDSVLTGNLSNVPQEVRRRLESAHPQGVIDHETLATGIMQSWVADTGAFSPESVRRDWPQIRKRVAQQYGATGSSDTELFVAVSNDRQTRQIRKQTLYNLYRETYERVLSSGADEPKSKTKTALAREDKSLQKLAEVIEKRAESDAMDDFRRLNDSATVVLRGLEGLVAAERALTGKSALKRGGSLDPAQMISAQVVGSYDVMQAARKLSELTPEDRVKVYRMLTPFLRKTPELKEAVTASLGRGLSDVDVNLSQLGINGLAWLLPEGAGKKKLDELARNLQQLREFAHYQYTPLHEEKENAWVRNLLVDMGQMGATTALAFCGPYGLAAVMGSETGNAMATARALNPEGDFDAQMVGAVASGAVNAALSLGMSKLGQRLLGQSLQGFRAVRPGHVNWGALKESAGRMAVDAALMTTENKLTELTPMLSQEVVGAATDKAAGVDWGDWRDRQLSVSEQLKEAAMMMPFLLIGAGRSALGHFRRPDLLLGQGETLSLFGISAEKQRRLVDLARTDVNAAGELLQRELRQSPLWSNPFFATKAVEWSRILNEQTEPFFRSEKEARDFLKLPAPIRARPWNDRSWEMVAKIREAMGDKPEFDKIRTEWLTRAGLLKLMVRDLYRPDNRYRIPKYETDEFLATWYEQLRRNEQDDLAILDDKNGAGITKRLLGNGPFDFRIDEVRQLFLEDRLARSIYRPYKMLLLTYPEGMGAKADKIDWAARASDLEVRNKANLHEGVMELVYGATQEEVNMHVACRFWESVCRERYGGERGRRWLEEGAEVLGIKRMRRDRKQKKTLLSSLAEMSIRMAKLSAEQRERISPELNEMNRLVWEAMADVKGLFLVLPNLSDFDAAAGRALRPVQCFSYLLTRMLECDPVTTSLYSSHLSAKQLRVDMEPVNKTKAYPRTAQVKANLSTLYPINVKSMMADGERLWCVRYPEGTWTNWHTSKRAAEAEMMARVSRLFTPACRSKHDVIKEWLKRCVDWDAKLNFIYYNLRDLPESSQMTAFEKLTHLAAAELLLTSYGNHGAMAEGERLIMKKKERLREDVLLLLRGTPLEGRIADEADMDKDSVLKQLPNVKGLMQNELSLFTSESPMVILDSKAMTVWNRLIRTGQLGVDEAWDMLERLGKVPKGKKFTNEEELMTHLCRLSKEYLFTKLDHEDVPKVLMLWLRYGTAMPDYADKQLPDISRASWELAEKIKKKNLAYEYESMLQESIGINNFIKMERLWNKDNPVPRQSVMERYAHGLISGRLLSMTPEHVSKALVERIAALEADVADSEPAEQVAQRRMKELSVALKKYPELNSWRVNAAGRYPHWEKFDRQWYHPTDDWREEAPKPILYKVSEPVIFEKEGFVEDRKAGRLLRLKQGTMDVVHTLEAIREVFATLPEATEYGIMWQGELYRIDSEVLPRGVTESWNKRLPLVDTIPLIKEIIKRKGKLRMIKAPVLPDADAARMYYSSCVIYRNPQEPGHSVRLMPGIPEAAVPEARAPYVVHCWKGVYLNKDGSPALTVRDSFIPLECFTGAGKEPDEWPADNTRNRNRRRILRNLSDPMAQMREWWSPVDAGSCLVEDVIRLYEELGVRRALIKGEMDLMEPVVVQTMNLVAHLLNDPLMFRTSMERHGEKRIELIRAGRLLKNLMESHEQP